MGVRNAIPSVAFMNWQFSILLYSLQVFVLANSMPVVVLIKLVLVTDGEFRNILESQKNMIKERTNSKMLDIVTTSKERFKKKTDFRIKDKRGEIGIIDY